MFPFAMNEQSARVWQHAPPSARLPAQESVPPSSAKPAVHGCTSLVGSSSTLLQQRLYTSARRQTRWTT